MNTRALVIFLGINVVLSVAIGYKYFSNENQSKDTPPVIQQQSISLPGTTHASSLSVNAVTEKTNNSENLSNQNLSPMTLSMQELKNQSVPVTPITENNSNSTNQPNTNITTIAAANTITSLPQNESMVQHIMNLQQGNQATPNLQNNNTQNSANTVVTTNNLSINNNKVCTVLGPLDLKDKATMDLILSKDSNANKNQIEVSQKPIYEIYWNLGKDRDEAEALFQKQKQSGTMQEDKFVLVQDESKDWIVSIAEVNSSLEYARSIANQLATTGSKYNAGGKWNYRTKPNAYFYKFDDFSQIDNKTKNSLNVMLTVNKIPC